MITPADPAARISKEFAVADIENRKNGSVIAIDSYDGDKHTVHYDWGSWIAFLRKRARTDPRYRVIYAHNGGGWDWLSLLEWMIVNTGETEFQTIQNGCRIISVTINLGNNVTVKLMDSLWLLFSSLDEAGKKYVGRGKVATKHLPEWYWEHDREYFWRYFYGDTELLYDVMVKVADLIYSKIAPIPKLRLTLPATALQCFRTAFLDREISTPENERVKGILRAAYVGGRVECFRPGYYKNVQVYDFNSLYPSVMADTDVPVTGDVQWTKRLRLDKCGVYHVSFRQRDRSKLPCLLVGGFGAYHGSGVYFTNELRRFPGKLSVHGGFVFREQGTLFRGYVENLYRLRMTDRSGPLGELCKRMLNSLYGKFAQKPVRARTIHADIETIEKYRDSGCMIQVLSAEYGIYRVTDRSPISFEHVGIAGTITSEARGRLFDAFGKNHSDVIYCDTDSVHCLHNRNSNPDRLGSLKHVCTGEGVYAGKKLYALRYDGKEEIKAKGVRVKRKPDDDLGFALDFAGLRRIARGAKIVCKFRSAVTANAVLRGETACRFVSRKRTLRNTANVTDRDRPESGSGSNRK